MATSLDFEGHMKWAEAMHWRRSDRRDPRLEIDDVRGLKTFCRRRQGDMTDIAD
jgi:hypothetical protein